MIACEIRDFIEEASSEGESVLVHSYYGRSRCIIVVLAYLMIRYNWTYGKAAEFISLRKGETELKKSFVQQLISLQGRLHILNGKKPSTSWRVDKKIPFMVTDAEVEEQLVLKNSFLNHYFSAYPPAPDVVELCPLPPKKIKTRPPRGLKWNKILERRDDGTSMECPPDFDPALVVDTSIQLSHPQGPPPTIQTQIPLPNSYVSTAVTQPRATSISFQQSQQVAQVQHNPTPNYFNSSQQQKQQQQQNAIVYHDGIPVHANSMQAKNSAVVGTISSTSRQSDFDFERQPSLPMRPTRPLQPFTAPSRPSENSSVTPSGNVAPSHQQQSQQVQNNAGILLMNRVGPLSTASSSSNNGNNPATNNNFSSSSNNNSILNNINNNNSIHHLPSSSSARQQQHQLLSAMPSLPSRSANAPSNMMSMMQQHSSGGPVRANAEIMQRAMIQNSVPPSSSDQATKVLRTHLPNQGPLSRRPSSSQSALAAGGSSPVVRRAPSNENLQPRASFSSSSSSSAFVNNRCPASPSQNPMVPRSSSQRGLASPSNRQHTPFSRPSSPANRPIQGVNTPSGNVPVWIPGGSKTAFSRPPSPAGREFNSFRNMQQNQHDYSNNISQQNSMPNQQHVKSTSHLSRQRAPSPMVRQKPIVASPQQVHQQILQQAPSTPKPLWRF